MKVLVISLLGNDEKMKAQEVETVSLKFHDGTIKKALTVRYVPDVSKNVLDEVEIVRCITKKS